MGLLRGPGLYCCQRVTAAYTWRGPRGLPASDPWSDLCPKTCSEALALREPEGEASAAKASSTGCNAVPLSSGAAADAQGSAAEAPCSAVVVLREGDGGTAATGQAIYLCSGCGRRDDDGI